MAKKWTKEEINILKKNWSKVRCIPELTTLLPNRNCRAIGLKGWKIKLLNRNSFKGGYVNPSVNQDFFKKWSNNMAYILGLLAADGCLTTSGRSHDINLSLKVDDIDLVENVKDCIGKKLKVRVRSNRKIVDFRFGCRKMFDDLVKLGITPRKSLTLKFPKVPDKYLSHFIRGYVDGDGCLCVFSKPSYHRNRFQTSIVGTYDFLRVLRAKTQKLFDIYISEVKSYKRCNKLFNITMCSQNALKFCDWIYKDADLKLDRKYKKYLEAKKLYGNSNIKRGNNQYTKLGT